MKKLLAIILIFSCMSGFSQQNLQPVEKKGFVYHNDLSFGARIHTNGFSIYSDIEKFISVEKRRVYQIEIGEVRHPKQSKQSPDGSPVSAGNSPKPYIYGKQNALFVVRGSIGYRKRIGEKAEKSGIEVSYTYMVGPTIGLLKPYYLYVKENQSDGVTATAIKYSEEKAGLFLNKNSIYGSAGIFYGAGETKIIPGLHGKLGFHFDWAKDDEAIKEVEIGIALDAYIKKVPMMVIDNNMQFFPTLYAGIQFGRRK